MKLFFMVQHKNGIEYTTKILFFSTGVSPSLSFFPQPSSTKRYYYFVRKISLFLVFYFSEVLLMGKQNERVFIQILIHSHIQPLIPSFHSTAQQLTSHNTTLASSSHQHQTGFSSFSFFTRTRRTTATESEQSESTIFFFVELSKIPTLFSSLWKKKKSFISSTNITSTTTASQVEFSFGASHHPRISHHTLLTKCLFQRPTAPISSSSSPELQS